MDKRQASQMLQYLETRFTVSTESLLSMFGFSERTLKRLVFDINRSLDGSAAVLSDKTKTSLTIIDRPRFNDIKSRRYAESSSFSSKERLKLIFHLLATSKHITIDELSNHLYVSRATIISDIEDLRGLLEDFSISIDGVTNRGLSLIGDELQIRFFYLEHAKEYIDVKGLDIGIVALIDEEVDNNSFGAQTEKLIYIWLALIIQRTRADQGLKRIDRTYNALKNLPNYSIADRLIEITSRRLSIDMSPVESVFLAIPFSGLRISSLDDETYGDENNHLAKCILSEISAQLQINIEHPNLLNSFSRHVNSLINRMRYRVYVDEWYLPEIEKEQPVAFEMAVIAKKVIQKTCDLEVIDTEVALLAIWFGVLIEEQKLYQSERMTVGILTNHGAIAARLIRVKLMKELGSDYSIEVLRDHRELQSNQQDLDLLIHTNPIEVAISIPTIEIGMGFDVHELATRVRRHRFDLAGQIIHTVGAPSLLNALLAPHRFVRLDPGRSHREHIQYLSELLVEEGVVDGGFTERLLDSETSSTFQTSSGVSFPHAFVDSDRIILAIGVSAREQGDSGEKIMIVLGVPKEPVFEETILIDLYDEVIKLSSSPQHIQAISVLDNAAEFAYYVASKDVFKERY